jgi:hypothetical protein
VACDKPWVADLERHHQSHGLGGFHNDELDTKLVMSLWILIWSSFLLASFWNKTSSLSDVILQMSCTLLLYKTFPDSWFPSHDLLKCHLMVRPSQPSDNRNPVYVLQKWWWGQFKISLLNMWCVCAQVIWGEQKLIICCCKSTCMNQLGNGTWDHVAFMGYSHFHHEHNLSHVVSLIIPRVSFIAWDPYYNNSPSMYNFIKMHSCDNSIVWTWPIQI